ncbi:5'/3'-nucleotidase SurE [Chromatiales bacterium (ex Bugula neritina AB1)]|nr:5'/3'-nucleotidase SurE [Chromatiales bacterium (ex Bugula neritina AB1)]
MRILVSNDDGWHAPGILALAEAMRELADVRVVAPDRNRSAASNSLTLSRPIRITDHGEGVYSAEGTPVDCVNLALNGLFDWTPDLVVSGINNGPNLGHDVVYSGTVAAAMEGRFHGVPAVAFSLAGFTGHYETAARISAEIIKRCIEYPLPEHSILNVNIPSVPYRQLQGREVTRLGSRHPSQNAIRQLDPRGEPIYWIGGIGEALDDAEGTDFHAIHSNRVSVTPLDVDMTHHHRVSMLDDWLPGSAA